LLGAGLHQEQVESNFAAAVDLYKKVIADPKAGSLTVARALLQLGGCYERLGQPAEAQATYERVLKDYANNATIVTPARARLAALQIAGSGPTERLITNDRTLGGLGLQHWSPDGRYVIGVQLTSSEFAPSALVLRDVATANVRSLTKSAQLGFVAFSPDSRRFAAIGSQIPAQSVIAENIRGNVGLSAVTMPGALVVGSVAIGGPPIVIDIPAMAVSIQPNSIVQYEPWTKPLAWSADGGSLAYALPVSPAHSFDLEVMDVGTGARRALGLHVTGSPDLTWSPSGAELLVNTATHVGTTGELRLINVATLASRVLPAPGASGARLRIVCWNANGDLVVQYAGPATPQGVVRGMEDSFLLAVGDGRARKTCSGRAGGGQPDAADDMCGEVTRDGTRQLIWQSATKRLMLRDLATGADRPLTTASGEEYFGRLAPNDRYVVFASNRDGQGHWGLFAADVAAQPVTRPTRLSTFDDRPGNFDIVAWTADGFIANDTRSESNILRVNIEAVTGKVLGTERLTQDGIFNFTGAISPDNKRIVYWSRHGSRFGIAVMDSNGSNERLILETPQDSSGLQPTWRSTTEVIFTAPPPAADWGANFKATLDLPPVTRALMSLNISTGAVTKIGELSGMPRIMALPQFLPASGDIVALDPDYKTLRSRSVLDGSSRVLATFSGTADVDSFLVSPDGKRIAYVLAQRYDNGRACFSRNGPVPSVDAMLTNCEAGILTIATGERTQLTGLRSPQADVPGLVTWSPDGRFLIIGKGRPQLLDTTTGQMSPMIPPPAPLNWDRTASWSTDSSFLVITDKSTRFQLRQWNGMK
jgi:Tol biopolymer transport system component